MIGCILATDMSKHFSELGKFKSRINSPEFNPAVGSDKDMSMQMVFHLSDISNACKRFEICQRWTELLYQEFFNQGDEERKLGIPI